MRRPFESAAAQRAVADLQSRGMQFSEVAPGEMARMGAIVKPVTERIAASYDSSIVRLYNDEIARIRKQ